MEKEMGTEARPGFAAQELTAEIAGLLAERGRLLLAIDGRCGCGKSSLAAALAERLDGSVFHMDDFYLPFADRKQDWQRIPAGNMDLRRFQEEVLVPLCAGHDVDYRAYDCPNDAFRETRRVPFKALSIVEGSYSQHPDLRAFYDLRLFVTASAETQKERLQRREGGHFTAFEELWIPMEERYFRAFSIGERADRVIVTDRGDTGACCKI